MQLPDLTQHIQENVDRALAEDVGSGDITAALIPHSATSSARIICRQQAVICGTGWAQAVFWRLDPTLQLKWQAQDGDELQQGQTLLRISGNSRAILTGERCALNFLQTLSATASHARQLANLVAHTSVKLLDTRKTLPGLRVAQKYAVTRGGCHNHRMGLYDAFLIKENHINACGSIAAAISRAREIGPGKPVEIEVENAEQLAQALEAGADIVMLDNFALEQLREAVKFNAGRAKLEASGGITSDTLVAVAETGVDYISIGALTKDCNAVDLSLLIE